MDTGNVGFQFLLMFGLQLLPSIIGVWLWGFGCLGMVVLVWVWGFWFRYEGFGLGMGVLGVFRN